MYYICYIEISILSVKTVNGYFTKTYSILSNQVSLRLYLSLWMLSLSSLCCYHLLLLLVIVLSCYISPSHVLVGASVLPLSRRNTVTCVVDVGSIMNVTTSTTINSTKDDWSYR